MSAKEVKVHFGVTFKCAWRIAKQVRELMQQTGGQLTGIAEIDETYTGGKHRSEDMFDNKTAVIGIVEKKKDAGQAKALVTKQADATVALPYLRSIIAKGTVVHSDERKIYTQVRRQFDHEFENHSKTRVRMYWCAHQHH